MKIIQLKEHILHQILPNTVIGIMGKSNHIPIWPTVYTCAMGVTCLLLMKLPVTRTLYWERLAGGPLPLPPLSPPPPPPPRLLPLKPPGPPPLGNSTRNR